MREMGRFAKYSFTPLDGEYCFILLRVIRFWVIQCGLPKANFLLGGRFFSLSFRIVNYEVGQQCRLPCNLATGFLFPQIFSLIPLTKDMEIDFPFMIRLA